MPQPHRARELIEQARELQERARAGGGPDKVEKQHRMGKLTARERLAELLDEGAPFFEIGLLAAHDRYAGAAPAAGVVTGVGRVEGRPVVVVANDAGVKAGAWWPETIAKILRAQEVAMRNRLPIVYLVDSAGVNLPYQDGVFPGQYGAGRIFYYNSLMRRRLRVPQIAVVMGPCIAGGAYLPALSDVIIMVEGVSFMGLGGPNLVRGATGEVVDSETLGGAGMHTRRSAVAHYSARDDREALGLVRRRLADLPRPGSSSAPPAANPTPPKRPAADLLDLPPDDHRLSYDVEALLEAVLDGDGGVEFQAEHAPELLCLDARLGGRPVAVLANRRGLFKTSAGARVGGVIYAESARKAAYFVETAERLGKPLIYFQDVSGFMVGRAAEEGGIIRAGAEMVETMACATVPKLVVTINHASGAGYYAMAGQGFDPHFTLAWATARIGVMEGDSAVQAVHGPTLEAARQAGRAPDPETTAAVERTRRDYEESLSAVHAAARGHVDAVIDPRETRETLIFLLEAALARDHREHLALELLDW